MERNPTNTVDLYHSVYNTQIHSKENVRWVGGQSKFYVEFYGALSAGGPSKGWKGKCYISLHSRRRHFNSILVGQLLFLHLLLHLHSGHISFFRKTLHKQLALKVPLEEKDSCLGLFKHSILPNPYETLPSKWAFSRPWCSRLLNWERVTLFCGVSMGLKVWRGLKGLQGAKSQHLDMSANRPLHSCFWGLQQYNSQFVCIDLIL